MFTEAVQSTSKLSHCLGIPRKQGFPQDSMNLHSAFRFFNKYDEIFIFPVFFEIADVNILVKFIQPI